MVGWFGRKVELPTPLQLRRAAAELRARAHAAFMLAEPGSIGAEQIRHAKDHEAVADWLDAQADRTEVP